MLVRAALESLQAIYRPGFNYAKAGVMLLELSPQGMEQAELGWDDPDVIPSTGNLALPLSPQRQHQRARVGALDALNSLYGRGTVRLACGDIEHKPVAQNGNWRMKQERRTPRYTTHWADGWQ